MNICVFAGPTLAAREIAAELEAVCLPPVSQGDVYRVARLGPRAIGIVDGYFDRVPAVWHKEILWAMAQGIHVYGSASMGALRAAELETFGMVGVGKIFEAYHDQVLEDDDEVAVAHAPAEHGYRCLSEAMVNIRATLERAASGGLLSDASCAVLERIAKALFYPERSFPIILQRAAAAGVPAGELESLRHWLPTGQVNQKREDALAMLRLMRAQLADDPGPKQVSFQFEHTTHWDEAMRLAGAGAVPLHETGAPITTDALLDELRLQGEPYRQALAQSQRRALGLAEARRQGFVLDDGAMPERLREFCQEHGLDRPEGLQRWLAANHLTQAQLEALLREEALVQLVLANRDHLVGLFDLVRIRGLYGTLHARVLDKQRRLEAVGLLHANLDDVGLTVADLLQWHFARLGAHVPADPKRYAQAHGFEGLPTFLQALLREYCYQRLLEPTGERQTP